METSIMLGAWGLGRKALVSTGAALEGGREGGRSSDISVEIGILV